MSGSVIGGHDSIVLCVACGLGVWAKCKCGWIGSSQAASSAALASHARHVEASEEGA